MTAENVIKIDSRGPERFTDAGNTRRFVATYSDEFRYVPSWGTWLHWDGTRWARDDRGAVHEATKAVAASLWEDVAGAADRKEAARWAAQSESLPRLRAMVELARTDPAIAVDAEDLDADPWVLNVLNGTVQLRTGRRRPHNPHDLITKVAPVVYDEHAECPKWEAFNAEVLPDEDVRAFDQRWFGYCLTGDVSEQKIRFDEGIGANGKSTKHNVMARVLGDYARQAPPDLLMRRRDDPHPTGLADLQGARLVLASETAEGRALDEALVKRLTGGERIKARYMHRDFFEFTPSHKLLVATNHRPEIRGTDHGIWRRVRLVPYSVVIPDDRQDRHLEDKLAEEAAGILRWAVEGCLAWQRDGLTEPPAVLAATADYRTSMDVLGEFLTDTCVLHESASVKASILYAAYLRWAEAMGETPITQRKLGLALAERGFRKRTSNGVWWDGLGLGIEGDSQ